SIGRRCHQDSFVLGLFGVEDNEFDGQVAVQTPEQVPCLRVLGHSREQVAPDLFGFVGIGRRLRLEVPEVERPAGGREGSAVRLRRLRSRIGRRGRLWGLVYLTARNTGTGRKEEQHWAYPTQAELTAHTQLPKRAELVNNGPRCCAARQREGTGARTQQSAVVRGPKGGRRSRTRD